VGTLQAAFRPQELQEVSAQVQRAWQQPIHPNVLRVLTSQADPFRPALEQLAQMLRNDPVNARFELVPGPHNYAFNRGPGGFHMLLWHDRVLRGLSTDE
jgi:enterochelin esterase-like enzyme